MKLLLIGLIKADREVELADLTTEQKVQNRYGAVLGIESEK